jgi:lysophospholipase L1-like esterase
MKIILCFGDSNTWGYDPATKNRYPRDIRWPGVLRTELGAGYEIIEEGLNGRTTVLDDPIEPYRNGKDYLIPCLLTHQPIHMVTIMLGTNDLKQRFSLSAYDIAQGAGQLVRLVQNSECGVDGNRPQLLLIAPPPVSTLTEFADMFAGAREKSLQLADHYRNVAQEYSCEFLDAAKVIKSSVVDGIHFDMAEHIKLGHAVAEQIKDYFGSL